jgi:PPM family protein phosphatase
MGRYVSLRNRVQAVGLTDTGKVREHNEDSIALDGDIGLYVLADGMGGYNAGEVASGIAVKTITNLVREAFLAQELVGNDKSTGLHRPSIILRDAIARANKIIHQTSKSQTQCEGMGTTVVAALLHDNRITVAHVGDSRLYRLRKDSFEQLTMDHSLLQELVDRGGAARDQQELRDTGPRRRGDGRCRGARAARGARRLARPLFRRPDRYGRGRGYSLNNQYFRR